MTIICLTTNKEIESAIEELDNRWEVKEGKIIRLFHFPSFMKGIDFVNDVAKIAEKVNHHPIITINWITVKLSLKSGIYFLQFSNV